MCRIDCCQTLRLGLPQFPGNSWAAVQPSSRAAVPWRLQDFTGCRQLGELKVGLGKMAIGPKITEGSG